jgi:hypothetical protein
MRLLKDNAIYHIWNYLESQVRHCTSAKTLNSRVFANILPTSCLALNGTGDYW